MPFVIKSSREPTQKPPPEFPSEPAFASPPARRRAIECSDTGQICDLSASGVAHAAPDEPKRDYDVGRGKPPIEHRFKPGQSGNPKGRPKGAKGLKTLAKEVLSEKVNVRTARGVEKMSKMKALIHKQTELAFSGNVRALLACAAIWEKSVPEDLVKAPAAGEPSAVKTEELDVIDLATLQAFAAMLATREGDPS